MSTFQLSRLCCTILTDVYGDLAQRVVRALLDHGRQTAKEIARRAELPLTTVQRTIVALLQNRFLLYWSDNGSRSIYYYANWKQIYGVLWNGGIVAIVNEMHGDMAAEVVKNVLVNGNMRAQDFLENYNDGNVSDLMARLIESKIITPVLDHEFNPIEDIQTSMLKKHQSLLKNDAKLKSDSARLAAATTAMQEERDELLESKDAPHYGLIKVEEKKRSTIVKKDKYKIDPESVLGINYEKYLVLSRNRELVKLVEERVGIVTSGVYRRVLEVYAGKLNRCRQRNSVGNISTREVATGLDPRLDLEDAIAGGKKRSSSPVSSSGSAAKRARTVNGRVDVDSLNFDDPERQPSQSLQSVSQHLNLLVDSEIPFLTKISGSGEWHVPFEELMEHVRRVTFQKMIKNRLGVVAMRVLRIVTERGKVDERQLGNIALLQPADIRQHVSKLHECGALDLQEVPRSQDRAAVKTFYLWYHDPQRAYSHLVQDLYVTMDHLYTRLDSERKQHSILLAKLDREDVKNNEDEYLSELEKRDLNKLRATEERLLVQIMRVDGLVKIFRDY